MLFDVKKRLNTECSIDIIRTTIIKTVELGSQLTGLARN